MNKIYEWIDKVWQWIAETVFVRFEFDLPVEELKKREAQGRLVFATAQGGIFDYFIISSWCRSQGLGAILVANRKRVLFLAKPKYFFQILFRRKTYSELFMSEEPGPRLLFCPAHERKKVFVPTPVETLLCELHSTSIGGHDLSFVFVPLLILWRRHVRGAARKPSEYLLGLNSNPNLFGKIYFLLRQRRDSIVRSLSAFPLPGQDDLEGTDAFGESESMRVAKSVRRRILVLINQELRVVLGPKYLSPDSVKETLLHDPEIQKVISEVAETENVDRKRVVMRAYKNLNEIVANYKYRTIEVMYVLLTWLFTRLFDGVVVKEEELLEVREVMKNKPVVFIPCHRSHLDYLVIPYVLFLRDMVTPYIVAGINLAFWPAGPFMRTGGAFFIRRSFRGDGLYSICLRKYIEYLLKNRVNIKFFIEGTRSRSGKMLPPAYGILKMILEAYSHRVCDDIALVPVSICYDEVPEQGAYQKELGGFQKKKESASDLLKSRSLIKRNFGKVYVRFAPAIFGKEVYQMAQESGMDATLMLQKTAFQICKSINSVTYITPKAIVSSILVGHRLASLPLQEILRSSLMMGKYASHAKYSLSIGELLLRRAVEQTVRQLQRSSTLSVSDASVPRAFYCEPRKRAVLNFYKNNAIHCFVMPSILFLSFFHTLWESEAAQAGDISFSERWVQSALVLRNLLKFEFFFSPTPLFLKELEQNGTFFFGRDFLQVLSEEELISRLCKKLESWEDASLFMRLIGEVIDSHLTVLDYLKEHPGEVLEKKALVQKILKEAEAKPSGLSFPESVSMQNYTQAFLLLENLKLITLIREQDKTLVELRSWNESLEALQSDLKTYLSLMDLDLTVNLRQRGFPVSQELPMAFEPTFPS